jgi:hypothetical protein
MKMLKFKGTPKEVKIYIERLIAKFGAKATMGEILGKAVK